VIRPLLDVSRDDLRGYLEARGQGWVEDESNDALENPRNRIRHRVLPEMDRAYGGPVRPAIARSAALVREDGQWLDELSARRFGELAISSPDGLRLDAAALGAEPVPVRRRVLLEAIRTLAGHREVGLEHVEAGLEVLAGGCAGADVPGGRVELRRGQLVLIARGAARK
jgi:tRNA(Ile)-lysidine synthase